MQARSYYESAAPSLTKTVADQTIAIKPLPGDMVPLWDRATATVLWDGTSAWVDVPIEATTTYTAVRDGHHQHKIGEECQYDHSAVQAVQKLTVHTAADGVHQCLIATIVPEPDCAVDTNGFSSADGLAGFSGFVSWHDLTGKLVRVAKFEEGTRIRSVEADGDNAASILEVVDNAILYLSQSETISNSIITKAGRNVRCNFCHKTNCKAQNDGWNHCNSCGQYDSKNYPYESNCICARCGTCGRRFKGEMFIENTCACGGTVIKIGCKLCNKLICSHILDGDPNGPVDKPEITLHQHMLKDIFANVLSAGEYKFVKNGSHFIDASSEYQNAGYEYLHGMYVYQDNTSHTIAQTQMRNNFINKMAGFVRAGDMWSLGEGFHPVLDTYVELQVRIDMLNYYSYAMKGNAVHGLNSALYVNNPAHCTEAVMYIFNALKALPTTASDTQIAAVFDQWVSMVSGLD